MRPAGWLAGRTVWAVLLLTLTACGGTEADTPRPPRDLSTARAAGAAQVLADLEDSLATGDSRAAEDLAAPDRTSQRTLAAVVGNADRLRISRVAFRFVDADGGSVPPPLLREYGARAWIGDVTVGYRLLADGSEDTNLSTRVVFVDDGKAQRIAGLAAGLVDDDGEAGEPTATPQSALWLTGPVRSVASGSTLVISAGPVGRLGTLAQRAVTQVRRVLPTWRGRLVVERPATEAALEAMLGAGPGQYAKIAAVTTTVDGSTTRKTPVHVFINPGVFDRLGPRGAQVVLSHEATHVATGATFASMPTWLLEGFADYVALAHADIPVSTAASQILRKVRRSGAPTSLPTAAELDPSAPGLGATYEEAWTVCRYLAATYGEPTLIRFYQAVDRGAPIGTAFRRVVGVTERAFVSGWRADLTRLAGRGAS